MKQIRWLPLIVTMAISAVILFGGYTFYRSQIMEKPLTSALTNIEQVEHAEVVWNPSELKINLSLKPTTEIAPVMEQVYDIAKKEANSRKLNVEIVNDASNVHIDQFWNKALFAVAEAMSHQRYGDIPIRLEELAKQDQGVQVETSMDEQNVYITLKNGSSHKTILLPLQGSSMGVWPNEERQS